MDQRQLPSANPCHHVLQAAEEELIRNKGNIVNVNSVVSKSTPGRPPSTGYFVAKAAQLKLTEVSTSSSPKSPTAVHRTPIKRCASTWNASTGKQLCSEAILTNTNRLRAMCEAHPAANLVTTKQSCDGMAVACGDPP